MLRILIADDHPVVRQGLRRILAETSDLIVTDEASTGCEVLEKVQQGCFDLVLLDISMPDINGIDILKQWQNEGRSEPKALVLSIYPEEQYAVRALKTGAMGYIAKNTAPTELVTAIRKAALGTKHVSADLAEKLAGYLTEDRGPLHETLSDREFQIFRMIALGKTTKEIATELFLSVKTISTYRARILEKMNLKNNAQITSYAYKNQLVEFDRV